MTVSTPTDVPVDLEVDPLPFPSKKFPSDSFIDAPSDRIGSSVGHTLRDFEGDMSGAQVPSPEHPEALRIAFFDLGTASDFDAEAFRTGGAVGGDVALSYEVETVACPMPTEDQRSDSRRVQALVEGFMLGTHRYRCYKSADGYEGPSASLMPVEDDHDQASAAARPVPSRPASSWSISWAIFPGSISTLPDPPFERARRPTSPSAALDLRFGFW